MTGERQISTPREALSAVSWRSAMREGSPAIDRAPAKRTQPTLGRSRSQRKAENRARADTPLPETGSAEEEMVAVAGLEPATYGL